MVTQTTSETSSLNRYFGQATNNSPTPSVATNPTSNGLLSGFQSWVYSPVRGASAEAVQGVANRVSDIFNNNQTEITSRVHDIFINALIRKAPEKLSNLLIKIRSFQQNPSFQRLSELKDLASQLSTSEIQTLAPNLNDTGVELLVKLKLQLEREILNQGVNAASSNHFNISGETNSYLQETQTVLAAIIQNHEGALVQALQMLSQNMADPNGPLNILREQFNHPQHGVIAQSLNTFRTALTSRAEPCLRECKDAIDTYKNALQQNATSNQLTPHLQNLHSKLSQLFNLRNQVPQINTEQWNQLQAFCSNIDNILQNSIALPSHMELLGQVDIPLQILTLSFNSQRGVIEEATDIMVEGVGRILTNVEHLPQRMMQNILVPQSNPQSHVIAQSIDAAATQPIGAVSQAAATSIPGASFLNLGALETQGRQFLNSILVSAGSTASQYAAKALSTLVCSAFSKIREHIQRTTANQTLLNSIDGIITSLETAIAQSSWSALTTALEQAFNFMQQQQVYLQGMRLPINPVRTHSSAIPEFLQNITAHQNVLQPPEQRTPHTISANVIEQQEKLLKSRLTAYGPTKLVIETICGLDGSEALYADIFKASEISPVDLMATFRERLFAKIDQSELNFIRSFIAKATYDILILLSGYYVPAFVDNALDVTKKWPQSESKEEVLVKLLRNWLAVTSGAYNSVASTPASQAKDLNVMMEEAMKIKERNGGLSQEELFAAVAKTALDNFAPRIQWDQTIDQYFNVEIPSSSPVHFLNPVLKVLNAFCSFSIKAMIFIPQWIGNQILQGGAKIILSHTPFLKDYTDQKMESLRRNTPTSYAMQRMIYRQLQKVLLLLQQNLNEDPESPNYLLNRETNIKKVEITGLVEYVLEVLNKSQYRTQDRLSHFLHNQAPIRDRVGRELEEAALPEIMETAVMTISIAMNALTGEEELQQMLYDGLSVANNSFESNQPISQEEFAALEKGIREITDQIVETAMFHAIGEKFDFTNEKQKRGISSFMTALKDQTRAFTSQLSAKAREISTQNDLSASMLSEKIRQVIELSSRYNHDRVDALGKADGNRNFHTETKYHLNEICRNLSQHCNPIANSLNEMKLLVDQRVWLEKILQILRLSSSINQPLNTTIQSTSFSSEDVAFCKRQMALLESHLSNLRRNQYPLEILNTLEQGTIEFSRTLSAIEDLQKIQKVSIPIYRLFSFLKQEKLANSNGAATPRLTQLERQILDLTNTLPSNSQKELLNRKISNLMLARNQESVEAASDEFSYEYVIINARNSADYNSKMTSLRNNQNAFQSHLDQSILDFSQRFTQNQTDINAHATSLSNQTTSLQTWVESQQELPLWNLFVVDMQWITETVKNLAFDRVRSKMQQLFESLYQRHSYVGFVNQILFLPFLEKFGRHHLRN